MRVLNIAGAAVAVLLGVGLLPSSAQAAVSSFDLSTYQLQATYSLNLLALNPLSNKQANEASAVTFNQDTGTLFVVEDEGTKIYEISTTGTVLGSMNLTGFADTEGLTYVGGGKFVIVEERLRSIYELTYSANGTVARSSLPVINLGATVGNIGAEGVAYDPVAQNFVQVKEKTPTEVNLVANPNFAAGTSAVSSLFDPAVLNVIDLADVEVLAKIPSLQGTAWQDHLLLLSQESPRLIQTTRSGQIIASIDLTGLNAAGIEGVTVDTAGNLYLVAEPDNVNGAPGPARLFVFTPPAPVPLPAGVWLLLSGAAALSGAARRRRVQG